MFSIHEDARITLVVCKPQSFIEVEDFVMREKGFQRLNCTLRQPDDLSIESYKGIRYQRENEIIFIADDAVLARKIADNYKLDLVIFDADKFDFPKTCLLDEFHQNNLNIAYIHKGKAPIDVLLSHTEPMTLPPIPKTKFDSSSRFATAQNN